MKLAKNHITTKKDIAKDFLQNTSILKEKDYIKMKESKENYTKNIELKEETFSEYNLRIKEEELKKEKLHKEKLEKIREKENIYIDDYEYYNFYQDTNDQLQEFVEKKYRKFYNDDEKITSEEIINFREENIRILDYDMFLMKIEKLSFKNIKGNNQKIYRYNFNKYKDYTFKIVNMYENLIDEYLKEHDKRKKYDLEGEIPMKKNEIDFEKLRLLIISKTEFLKEENEILRADNRMIHNKLNDLMMKISEKNNSSNLDKNNFSDLEKKIDEDSKNLNKNLKKKLSISSEKSDLSEYSEDSSNGDVNLIIKKIENFINNVKKCYEENNNFDKIQKYIKTKSEVVKFCGYYCGLTNDKVSDKFKGLEKARRSKDVEIFYEWSKENIFMKIIKDEIEL